MLRARLATLTLAGGLVLSTGCQNLSDRFHCWRMNLGSRGATTAATHGTPECPCQETGLVHGAVPTGIEGGGPVLVQPDAPMMGAPMMAPPVMTAPPAPPPPGQPAVPMGPPPRIVPSPATAVPWQGQ